MHDEHLFINSSYIEQMVEHAFISKITQEIWFSRKMKVEVLHSEIDSYGYDVVMECNGIIRHIQLKTSISGGTTKYQKVNVTLADKPAGCVIWIIRKEDYKMKEFKFQYKFFGNKKGQPMPDISDLKIAKHNKSNSLGIKKERPQIKQIPKGKFETFETINELVDALFF